MNLLKYFLSLTLILGPYAQAWDQATSKVVQVDQASGVSSTPNYWKSGDAELTLSGVAAYNDGAVDKPVDCTGGSSTMTGVRSTTNPMYDKFSWLVSKPAGNMQGQGVAFEFDVDNGVAGVQGMDLLFDYMLASGTFTAGDKDTSSDLMIYLYDVTAGQLIEPKGGSKLLTSSTTVTGSYRGWFQSTLGSKKYRVCLHQATTSASSYGMIVDAGKVQKSKYVVGTIITDWESFTPIITHVSGSATNYTAFGMMRQVGDTYEVISSMKFSAASAAFNELYMRVPKNGSIDFNKMPLIGVDVLGNSIGGGHSYDAGATLYPGSVQPRAPNIVEIRTAVQTTHTGTAAVSAQPITNTFPFTYNSGDTITMRYAVPIVGLSAGARMSDGYDGLTVKLNATSSSMQSIPSGAWTKVTSLVASNDSIGGLVAGEWTVPSSGDYDYSFYSRLDASAAGTYRAVWIYLDGIGVQSTFSKTTPSASLAFGGKTSGTINGLVAGQKISFYINQDSGSALNLQANSSATFIKRSGTPFMSPTALWETHYAGTAGDAIGTSDSLIKFTTKVEDTFGSYNPATGLWTAKGPATCSTDTRVQGVSVNMSTTQSFGSALRKDGAAINNGTIMYGAGVSRVPSSIISASSIKVVQGTTLSVYAYSDVATTASTSQTSNYFTVSCR